ncbi:SRPBCC family protein [Nonomuraea sediminis]|uniref:SRPBCC family protein n=1 Tax=Nonomuraea sediminis TaxID=2835864 RepID=UPI001BDBE941|nr:SRPBCC family protein [Nonomuraea sediminis]
MLYNMHERVIKAAPEEIWPILCDIESLWPEDIGSFRLPEGLHPGARVHHSGMRYRVKTVEPFSTIWFDTSPDISDGHGFTLTPTATGTRVRHEIKGRTSLKFTIVWPLLIRRKHDIVIERILDALEREVARAHAR